MDKLNQQGDVLFFGGGKLPENVRRIEPRQGRYILAEGEATGHAHAVAAQAEVALYEDTQGQMFLVVGSQAEVRHEEHGPIVLDEDVWKIGFVREVDPFSEAVHRVFD